ncbi:MAG: hypothetical protein ACTSQB_03420 [Candidatus Heimdallarchaeota archaeon]
MTPKKKKSQSTRRKKHGTLFTVGQILIIFGAILTIVAAIIDLINFIASTPDSVWNSYTFGQLNIPYLGQILAIIMGFLILWLAVDRRVYNKMKLYLYAALIIVLAVIAGNIGALIIIIGALLIIFYRISKN